MRIAQRRLFPILFAEVILLIGLGCGDGGGAGIQSATPTKTPAEYFAEKQVNTMTPHGKIMTDTVEEKEGKIRYKTEDGKQWSVTYSKRADGTYQYGMPDEAK